MHSSTVECQGRKDIPRSPLSRRHEVAERKEGLPMMISVWRSSKKTRFLKEEFEVTVEMDSGLSGGERSDGQATQTQRAVNACRRGRATEASPHPGGVAAEGRGGGLSREEDVFSGS